MKNTLTLTEKETFFLKENRQDPVTGDSFDIGDEIVFCASCKSAFLKESWEYMNSKHCGQTFTLKEFPAASNLKLSKPIVYDFQKPNIGSRGVAYLIDNIIGIICGFIAYTFFTELRGFFRFDAEFSGYVVGSLYMLFRDIFGIKSSIGKQIMGLYFIDYELKKKAHIVSLLFRNLVYWVFLCMIISIIIILELKIDAENAIAIVGGFCLIIANITHIIAVLANQNNIFDRMLSLELVENK